MLYEVITDRERELVGWRRVLRHEDHGEARPRVVDELEVPYVVRARIVKP